MSVVSDSLWPRTTAHQAPIPGILQARIPECVAISFSSAWKWKVKVKSLSHVWLFETPWTVAYYCSDFTFTFHVHDWRRKWQPTPVSLPGKSHGQRSLVGCSPWGRKESGTTERLTLTLTLINKSVELCSFKALPHMLFHIAFTRKDVMEVERRTGRTLLL